MGTQNPPEPLAKGEKGDENRDENGRFRPGHSLPGPGNPYSKRVAELRNALLDAVSLEDVAAMVAAMIRKAKDGDAACFRILAGYIFGRPADAPKGDEEDGDTKGPLVVEFVSYIRPDGTEIQHEDADWPEALDRERNSRRNVLQLPGDAVGL